MPACGSSPRHAAGSLASITDSEFEGRVIGIIEGEQVDNGKKERNDRIVAVEHENHSFANIRHIRDLGDRFLRELETLFVNYQQLSGKQFRVSGVKGPAKARKRIAKN